MSSSFKICLVGAGNMGGAMLAGWLESGFAACDVTVIDPGPRGTMAQLLSDHQITALATPPENYQADVLIIAVKPQMMETVLPILVGLIGKDTVSVSVAAGTTIAAMEKHLGDCAIVRAMPNTPALLRKGITVGCPNGRVSDEQRDRVDRLLQSIGKVEWVEEEKLIDAVTAVSGSGPAYVFHLAEAMAAAGIEQGLSADLANKLARETIAGAGEMLSQLSDSSSTLRENVTSPNGTTAAALAVLMADPGLKSLLSRAIEAARKRSVELAAGK
ncbi:MAG: pyrroline-5-carboxylate reductase [Salaquimonas sp.]